MPEHNSTVPIDNADASGEALVMKVSFSEKHNDFEINWNIKSIDAYLVVIRYNFDGTVYSEQRIDQPNETNYTYNLEQNYNLKFYIEISKDGVVSKTSNEVIVSPKGLIFEGGDQILTESIFGSVDGVIYDLRLRRKPRTFNIIDGLITFAKTTNFIYEDIQSVDLYYRSAAETNWSKVENFVYQRGTDVLGSQSKEVVGYTINFDNLQIDVPTEGSTLEFYVEIASKNLNPQTSSTKTLRFTPLSPTQSLIGSNNSIALHPKPYKPAGLRYEVKTVISESYYEVDKGATESVAAEKDFYHFFSDEDDFGGIEYPLPNGPASTFTIDGQDQANRFVYEADYGSDSEENYKGFIYPASISEILPCINVIGSGEQKQVKLSWKIIDDFFDYQLYAGQLRIVTTELKVNIKYYNSGTSSYGNLISNLTLSSSNYISNSNTFVFIITTNELEGNSDLFAEISVDDNATDNLIIEIVSHKVDCTINDEGLRSYNFNKLLLPPRWTHIVYDRFISDYSERNSDGTLSLDIYSKKLRGIKLPDRGFKVFDTVKNVKRLGTLDTYKIIYKLTTQTNATYLDPIREGTITYVDIGQQPDNVFLVPPILNLPDPNIDPFGKKAEGEVVLDEYGKIAGVRILDPGYGYSMFKTEADKRIQTFVDFVPVVKSSYKVLSSDSGITRDVLNPVNSSFSNLKASIEGGRLLNNAGANQGALSAAQQAVLDDYKARNNIDVSDEENDSNNNIYDTDVYANTLSDAYNSVSIEVLDPEWYDIVSLYKSKTLAPSDDFAIYNEDLDPAAAGLDGSEVSDVISSASNSTEIIDTDITNESQADLPDDGAGFSLNNLEVYTDASAASSVFKSSSVPPWLTIEPLEVRRDGAPAYGALPYMLTRASSFFNRISVGVNHLNKVRLILPSIWDTRTKTVTTNYTRTNNLTGFELSEYSNSGTVSRTITRNHSYYPSNSGVGLGAQVARTVSVQETGIVSSEYNQSQVIYPKIHPWLKKSIPDIFTRKVDKNFLAIQVAHTTSCSFYNTDGLVCGTSRISIPETVNVPENTLDGPDRSIKIFNGGTIRLNPFGTSYNLNIGSCNYNCGDSKDVALDFKYSNLYPYVLKI